MSAGDLSGLRREMDGDVFERLHASALIDETEITRVLTALVAEQRWLTGRRTVRGDAEEARILKVEGDQLVLECRSISTKPGQSLYLNFSDQHRSHFFAAEVLRAEPDQKVHVRAPAVIYVTERRDRWRCSTESRPDAPRHVRMCGTAEAWQADGEVSDYSPVGMLIECGTLQNSSPGTEIRVQYLDGRDAGCERWAVIRHARPAPQRPGRLKLGLSVSDVPAPNPIDVEARTSISNLSRVQRARESLALLSSGAAAASSRVVGRLRSRGRKMPPVHVVDYPVAKGVQIRGIVNGNGSGGTSVLIPPAWGRTKETLLPLASTIVETFRRAGEPVSVLRFDGTRRRGESFKEAGFDRDGDEHLAFRLHHAVEDILASARFLASDPSIAASKVILVSFSAASIESRRAIQVDQGASIHGWISVVGSPDLQSGMRTVSGGIDFVAGVDAGIEFGVQEVMGVAVDIDSLMKDALKQRLAFLEDALRDMSEIEVPVTWIHGANDAWLDLARVRAVMGSGGSSQRRLIEVPTGHQLRSSREALDVFKLVAEQVAEMALSKPVRGVAPSVLTLETTRDAERARLPRRDTDVRSFWRDYLIGREGSLGIDLMNATDEYRELMVAQIEALALRGESRVADIGSGTGSFPQILLEQPDHPEKLEIDEIDLVPEALKRTHERLRISSPAKALIRYIECDLDDASQLSQLGGGREYDAVLLSLVLSYVQNPGRLVARAFSLLKPGGRFVASTLKRDADISKLYVRGIDQLRSGRARQVFGAATERRVNEVARLFLNDMARLVDLEEQGVFRFLDGDEISLMVSEAGFQILRNVECLGSPPQAVVVVAEKPA